MFSIVEGPDEITITCPCGATESVRDEHHLSEFECGRGLDGSTDVAFKCTSCGHTDKATRMNADP
ncbi:hypothetical protein HALO32_02625 [Halomonas lysinitropha]|uniref:Uncharacterized protein n=1 Tax=Halomonas lysinitropha TaxID=2607506 RepID=A0A5K1I4H1_9GAMM|nr:hypothetical protein HALO32_02625 [Halomonas lysinitropha]